MYHTTVYRPRGKVEPYYSVQIQGKGWTILQCTDLGERLDHTTVYRPRGKAEPYYSVQTKGKGRTIQPSLAADASVSVAEISNTVGAAVLRNW